MVQIKKWTILLVLIVVQALCLQASAARSGRVPSKTPGRPQRNVAQQEAGQTDFDAQQEPQELERISAAQEEQKNQNEAVRKQNETTEKQLQKKIAASRKKQALKVSEEPQINTAKPIETKEQLISEMQILLNAYTKERVSDLINKTPEEIKSELKQYWKNEVIHRSDLDHIVPLQLQYPEEIKAAFDGIIDRIINNIELQQRKKQFELGQFVGSEAQNRSGMFEDEQSNQEALLGQFNQGKRFIASKQSIQDEQQQHRASIEAEHDNALDAQVKIAALAQKQLALEQRLKESQQQRQQEQKNAITTEETQARQRAALDREAAVQDLQDQHQAELQEIAIDQAVQQYAQELQHHAQNKEEQERQLLVSKRLKALNNLQKQFQKKLAIVQQENIKTKEGENRSKINKDAQRELEVLYEQFEEIINNKAERQFVQGAEEYNRAAIEAQHDQETQALMAQLPPPQPVAPVHLLPRIIETPDDQGGYDDVSLSSLSDTAEGENRVPPAHRGDALRYIPVVDANDRANRSEQPITSGKLPPLAPRRPAPSSAVPASHHAAAPVLPPPASSPTLVAPLPIPGAVHYHHGAAPIMVPAQPTSSSVHHAPAMHPHVVAIPGAVTSPPTTPAAHYVPVAVPTTPKNAIKSFSHRKTQTDESSFGQDDEQMLTSALELAQQLVQVNQEEDADSQQLVTNALTLSSQLVQKQYVRKVGKKAKQPQRRYGRRRFASQRTQKPKRAQSRKRSAKNTQLAR